MRTIAGKGGGAGPILVIFVRTYYVDDPFLLLTMWKYIS